MANEALIIEYLDHRQVHKKRRRFSSSSPETLETLPTEWRELLVQWVRRGGSSRWETLLKQAGVAKQQIAEALLQWLLSHGWAQVDEERKLGDWWPSRLQLRHIPALRAQLGLPDMDQQALSWQALKEQLTAYDDDRVLLALDSLSSMPLSRAMQRAPLAIALLDWLAAASTGTRRDFSLYARHGTKEITDSEWQWLDILFDLAECKIEQHTPLLLISANLKLHTGLTDMDLKAIPDFAALTPATMQTMQAATGLIGAWILVENRTSFERLAKQRNPDQGVIWLPGFPPSWWKTACLRLLTLAPAPVKIACDPDPAGIAIAFGVIQLLAEAGVSATSWKMGVAQLNALAKPKTLSEFDEQLLDRLMRQSLPEDLQILAQFMKENKQKGEQEGYL